MRRAQLPNPKKIIAVWAGGILLLFCTVSAYNVLLHGQVEAVREQSPWTYLKQAEQFRQQSNMAAALRMLERAAELDPKSPEPHERAGLIYYDTKQWAQSLEAYQRALTLGTPALDPRGKIIWCYIHLGRALEGAEFGERCIQEGKATDAFPRYVAHAYRLSGKNDKAIEFYEAARRKDPNDLYLIERLVELYELAGKPDHATALQQRVTDLESTY